MWPWDTAGEDGEKKSRYRKSCEDQRQQLLDCLLTSECVNRDNKSPKECLKMAPHPSIPNECLLYKRSFLDCKRASIDMRQRFRGRRGVDYDRVNKEHE